jgi:replicative DNA helicase
MLADLVAEIIVAKHRNSPGKVRLAFIEHLTTFANLTRR